MSVQFDSIQSNTPQSNPTQIEPRIHSVESTLTELVGELPTHRHYDPRFIDLVSTRCPLGKEDMTRIMDRVHDLCHKSAPRSSPLEIFTFGTFAILRSAKGFYDSAMEHLSGNEAEARIQYGDACQNLILGISLSASLTGTIWGLCNIWTDAGPPLAGISISGMIFSAIGTLAVNCEREENWIKDEFSKDPLISNMALRFIDQTLPDVLSSMDNSNQSEWLSTLERVFANRLSENLAVECIDSLLINSRSNGDDLALQYRVPALIGRIAQNYTLALTHLGLVPGYCESWDTSEVILPLVEDLILGVLAKKV